MDRKNKLNYLSYSITQGTDSNPCHLIAGELINLFHKIIFPKKNSTTSTEDLKLKLKIFTIVNIRVNNHFDQRIITQI